MQDRLPRSGEADVDADLTIAEELLLVAWDDDRGWSPYPVEMGNLLAGAVLIDLALAEAVVVADGRVRAAADAGDTGEPLLDRALATLRSDAGQRTVGQWMSRLVRRERVRAQVLARLAERGVTEPRKRRLLGLVPVTRHPVADRALAAKVRADLAADLLAEGDLPARRAALGGLAAPFGQALMRRLYTDRDDRRAALRHAKELARGEGISGDVGKAVRDAQAAALVAVTAGAAAAAAASN